MPKPKAIARVINEKDPVPSRLEGPSNERQALFVKYYAETGTSGADAARLAGYADPPQSAWRLLSLPHVRAAIRAEREKLIHGDLAKKALATLAELMEPGTPAPVRLGASRTALEMAHHLGVKETPRDLDSRPLAELSVGELEELVRRGQDVLASAKIVPAEVIPAD